MMYWLLKDYRLGVKMLLKSMQINLFFYKVVIYALLEIKYFNCHAVTAFFGPSGF